MLGLKVWAPIPDLIALFLFICVCLHIEVRGQLSGAQGMMELGSSGLVASAFTCELTDQYCVLIIFTDQPFVVLSPAHRRSLPLHNDPLSTFMSFLC